MTFATIGTLLLALFPDFNAVFAETCLTRITLDWFFKHSKTNTTHEVFVDFLTFLEDHKVEFDAHKCPCRLNFIDLITYKI